MSRPEEKQRCVAQDGDRVRVHYNGTMADGEQIDSSAGRAPLEFVLGEGEIVPGFEAAVLGLSPGQSKTVTFPPEQGYGPYVDELAIVVERSQLPSGLDPALGQQLQLRRDNQVLTVTITNLSESSVSLDGNHPLAGKELTFEIELVEIL